MAVCVGRNQTCSWIFHNLITQTEHMENMNGNIKENTKVSILDSVLKSRPRKDVKSKIYRGLIMIIEC